MIAKKSKTRRLNLAWLVVAMLALAVVNSALAQEEPVAEEPPLPEELQILPEDPHMPGRIEGTGTYFEVTDSNYVNLTFASSEPVHLTLESVPRMVVMDIEAAEGAPSTQITLNGFAPSTTYYKYQDDYHNGVAFTTDGSGSYTYAQDLAIPHHVFIQPQPGTKFIPSDTAIGTWDSGTRTYTLTEDVYDSLQIDEDNLTLDGAGHTVSGSGTGIGVSLGGSWGHPRRGLTVKNLIIQNFSYGIGVIDAEDNSIVGNTVSGNQQAGIYVRSAHGNTLANNTASSNVFGIYLTWAASSPSKRGNVLTDNMISNNEQGIRLDHSCNCVLSGNSAVSNSYYGIYLSASYGHILTANSMEGNRYNFGVHGTYDEHYDNDIDTTNTVDGKPVYYVTGAQGQIYDGATNAGVFYAISCDSIVIKDLVVTKNRDGVFLWNTHNSRIENVAALSNEWSGITLTFSNNNTVMNSSCTFSESYFGIIVSTSSGNVVKDNITSNNGRSGIGLGASDNTVVSNTVSDNGHGFWLEGSSSNTLCKNIVCDNDQYGMFVFRNNNTNEIRQNTIFNNGYAGLYFYNSNSENTITGNAVSGSYIGITLYYYADNNYNVFRHNTISNNSQGISFWNNNNCNQVYNNNFINNQVQAKCGGTDNIFNLDKPIGGNFWSNWTTPDVDHDGFVDFPYQFAGGVDYLPLALPYVANQPPIADAGPDQTIEQESYEGAEVTLDGSGSTDADSTEGTNDDIVSFDWYEGDTLLGSGEIISYTLALGTHVVTLVVTDSHDEVDEDEVIIIVQDTTPPEITIYAPQPYGLYPVGGLVLDFLATDATCEPQVSATLSDTTGYSVPVQPDDVVMAAGVYTLLVEATDAAGNYAESEVFFVVYDPEGGFVTGGGWIDSPEGAYKPDPSLVGKANFGFVSKYKKGATVPTGNTEFVFKTGDLNFHSSSYEWLVVTGSSYARFKGTGTINGSGEYKFMLWAGDGGKDTDDTFRIKIWEEDEFGVETVQYDNGFDQAIAGGSIVVHAK